MHDTGLEMQIFTNYLVDKKADSIHIDLYKKGVDELSLELTESEKRMLQQIIRRPYFVRFVDIGLALFMKESNLRKRIILASSILECDAKNINHYLNRNKIKFGFAKLVYLSFVSAFFIVSAFILFKANRWK